MKFCSAICTGARFPPETPNQHSPPHSPRAPPGAAVNLPPLLSSTVSSLDRLPSSLFPSSPFTDLPRPSQGALSMHRTWTIIRQYHPNHHGLGWRKGVLPWEKETCGGIDYVDVFVAATVGERFTHRTQTQQALDTAAHGTRTRTRTRTHTTMRSTAHNCTAGTPHPAGLLRPPALGSALCTEHTQHRAAHDNSSTGEHITAAQGTHAALCDNLSRARSRARSSGRR